MRTPTHKVETADAFWAGMLYAGVPTRMTVPAWMAQELVACYKREGEPGEIGGHLGMFGLGIRPLDVLNDIKTMSGYSFSWGSISERHLPGETVAFEVFAEQLLVKDIDPAHWKKVLTALSNEHDLASEEFRASEAANHFHAVRFEASGRDVPRLRAYLAGVFLPQILPDVLTEGERTLAGRTGRRTLADIVRYRASNLGFTRGRPAVNPRYYGPVPDAKRNKH